MVSKFSRRGSLRAVESLPAVDEAAAFYDRTIPAAWRLALHLHGQDPRRAGDAVVDAYREVWAAGPAQRHQAALLHALVTAARREPVPA